MTPQANMDNDVQLLNQKQTAAALGLSAGRLSQLKKEGRITYADPYTGETKSVDFTQSGTYVFRWNADGSRSQAAGHLFGSSGNALETGDPLIDLIRREWAAYRAAAKRELAKY